MNRLLIVAALVGCCLAMPQRGQSAAPKGNPFVRILSLESYQNGADFGHSFQQEDGTAVGQKIGPDGLLYGFYSYIQEGGNVVKVYYRAGKGVGYEVLRVEGLNIEDLGNLKPTISATPLPEITRKVRPAQTIRQQAPIVREQVVRQRVVPEVRQQVVPEVRQRFVPEVRQRVVPEVHHRFVPEVRQRVVPEVRQRVVPVVRQPIVVPQILPAEPTPAPHRFDYPATLNLQRTATGFISSFKAL